MCFKGEDGSEFCCNGATVAKKGGRDKRYSWSICDQDFREVCWGESVVFQSRGAPWDALFLCRNKGAIEALERFNNYCLKAATSAVNLGAMISRILFGFIPSLPIPLKVSQNLPHIGWLIFSRCRHERCSKDWFLCGGVLYYPSL